MTEVAFNNKSCVAKLRRAWNLVGFNCGYTVAMAMSLRFKD